MEEKFNINEVIKEMLENNLSYKKIIIDYHLIKNCNINEIETKCQILGLEIVDNYIAKEIRIIEVCDELIKKQSKYLDNKNELLPLIVLNNIPEKIKNNKYLSKVKTANEIAIDLNKEENNESKYMILTCDKESYIDDEVIYISVDDLLSLELERTTSSIDSYENKKNDLDISLFNIIPTYIEIMKPKIKFELNVETPGVCLLKSKQYQFKILILNDVTLLEKEDFDYNEYQLIIEENETTLNNNSILTNDNINKIYKNLNKIGSNFRK